MNYTLYQSAFDIVLKAFYGQRDKAGLPAVLHSLIVASDPLLTEDEQIAAILHDVVEDTHVTLDDLAEFPDHIVAAVDAMTHLDTDTYHDYISRVLENPIAVSVKKADICHNLSRLGGLDLGEQQYLKAKYDGALQMLVMG